jgi:vitamin B12 transporter
VDVVAAPDASSPDSAVDEQDRATTAFSTAARLPVVEPTLRSLGDVLARAVGVSVRSLGGPGAFQAVSIRGSGSGDVALFLDGVRLARGDTEAIDLSELPLDGLARIEIRRGADPLAALDSGGGTLRLVSAASLASPDHGPTTTMMVGGGSLGARKATALARLPVGTASLLALGHYAGATGTFDYYDDGATPFTRVDDRTVERQNAAYQQGGVELSLTRLHRGRLSLRFFGKQAGVPGTVARQSEQADLRVLRYGVDGGIEREWGTARVEATGDLSVRHERFRDPEGELGLGVRANDDTTLSGGLGTRARRALVNAPGTQTLLLEGVVDGRVDGLVPGTLGGDADRSITYSMDGTSGSRNRHRERVGVALGATWQCAGWLVEAATRLELMRLGGGGDAQLEVPFSARLGATRQLGTYVLAKASVARSVRVPTFYELFGGRGALVGNPELRFERSLGGDGGVVLQAGGARVELVGFGRLVDDPIQILPNSQLTARATNLGRTRMVGLETSLHIERRNQRRGTVRLEANYTLVNAVDISGGTFDGQRLPGRPRHEVALRADWSGQRFAGSYGVAGVSGAALDPSNRLVVPQRTTHRVELRGRVLEDLTLTGTVDNLLDQRVVDLPLQGAAEQGRSAPYPIADFLGRPLPGRTFFLSLTWSHR